MGRRDKAMQTLLSLLQDKSKREMFANTAVFSLLLSNRGSCVPVSGTVEPTDNITVRLFSTKLLVIQTA